MQHPLGCFTQDIRGLLTWPLYSDAVKESSELKIEEKTRHSNVQCLVCFRIAQDLRHSLVNATANSNASMRAVPEGINEKHSRPGSGKSRDHIVAFLQKGIWKEFSSQTAGEVLLPQKEQQGDSIYAGYTIGGHQNPPPSTAFPGTRSDECLKRDYCLVQGFH